MNEKPLKVLIITNMYPNDTVKWAGTFVEQQVLSLKQNKDIDVSLFVISGPVTGGGYLNYFKGYVQLLNLLYFSEDKFDIVHSHHYYMTLLYKLTFKSIPLVYTMHENNYFVTNRFTRAILKWCATHSTATLVVWNKMLKLFKPERTHFLPSGINIDIFKDADKKQSRKLLNLQSDRIYLFFPAPPKRIEKNAVFLESFVMENPDFIEKNRIEIIWGGDINYQDMSIYMNASDILVSFSDYESDGMTYKEAMACNLPVITFEAGNSTLYFNDNRAGSIIDKNEDSLKNSICYWMRNTSEGRDKLFEIEMDAKSVSSKLISIYKSLNIVNH